MAIQDRWKWCNKCQALSYAAGANLGTCAAGGSHNHSGSGNYALVDSDSTIPGQDNWRWCWKCQGLSYAGNASLGACSGGGLHDHAGSGNYNLLQKSSGAPGQENWRWCNKCQALTFAGNATPGICPAGGVHDHGGSGNYVLAQVADQVSESAKLVLQDALRSLPGPRHFGPSAFYLMGHNTNTIEEVHAALDQGANAVEVDVTAYSNNLNKLCIDHAGVTGDSPGSSNAPAFEDFLHQLRDVADQEPELAMVMFDLKSPAAQAKFGPDMIKAIRDILTKNSTLPVILSVAEVPPSAPGQQKSSSVFDKIHDEQGDREGYMIDSDNDTDGVVSFFKGLGVSRFGFGNGTSFPFSDEGAMVYRTPIEKACWLRATRGAPGFVDAWTVNSVDNLRLYLRVGVNGIISDPNGIQRAREILQEAEFSRLYRIARRTDNPMQPDNFAYGLTVKTADTGSAGTDSKITFTLTGQNGSASTVVDTYYNARMEKGQTNYVVIHSPDLGPLKSVSVKSDQSRSGPGWHLASIQVQSFRYGVNKSANFDREISTTDPVTRNLV